MGPAVEAKVGVAVSVSVGVSVNVCAWTEEVAVTMKPKTQKAFEKKGNK